MFIPREAACSYHRKIFFNSGLPSYLSKRRLLIISSQCSLTNAQITCKVIQRSSERAMDYKYTNENGIIKADQRVRLFF